MHLARVLDEKELSPSAFASEIQSIEYDQMRRTCKTIVDKVSRLSMDITASRCKISSYRSKHKQLISSDLSLHRDKINKAVRSPIHVVLPTFGRLCQVLQELLRTLIVTLRNSCSRNPSPGSMCAAVLGSTFVISPKNIPPAHRIVCV